MPVSVDERRLDRIRAAWPGSPERLAFVYDIEGHAVGVIELPRLRVGMKRFEVSCLGPRSLRAAYMPGPSPSVALEMIDDSPLFWAVASSRNGGAIEDAVGFVPGLGEFPPNVRRLLAEHPDFELGKVIQRELDYLPKMLPAFSRALRVLRVGR